MSDIKRLAVFTFSTLLHIGAVIGSCQHRHRVAAVLSREAILEGPRNWVIEYLEGKLGEKQKQNR